MPEDLDTDTIVTRTITTRTIIIIPHVEVNAPMTPPVIGALLTAFPVIGDVPDGVDVVLSGFAAFNTGEVLFAVELVVVVVAAEDAPPPPPPPNATGVVPGPLTVLGVVV